MKRRSTKASSAASKKGKRTHKQMQAVRKPTFGKIPEKKGRIIPPVILPPSLYDAAKRAGVDMRGYVKAKRIPREGLVRLARTPTCRYRATPRGLQVAPHPF